VQFKWKNFSYICFALNTPCCFACKVSFSHTLPRQMDCNEILIPMQSLQRLHFNVSCFPVLYILFCLSQPNKQSYKFSLVSLVPLFKILLWFSFCHISTKVLFIFHLGTKDSFGLKSFVQFLLWINCVKAINHKEEEKINSAKMEIT